MGTDIHPILEVRRKGVWHTHVPKTECPFYYEFKYVKTGLGMVKVYDLDPEGNRIRSKWDKCKYRLPEAFWMRNYMMFAILANVRNDNVPYIDSERGLPNDLAAGSRAWRDSGEYDHSHGWVDLTELMNYDMDQEYELSENISAKAYEALRDTGKQPDDWGGYGSFSAVVPPEVYDQIDPSVNIYVENGYTKQVAPANWLIQHTWTRKVSDYGSDVLAELITYMRTLVPQGGTSDDVRMLFYFDS